MTLYSNTKKEQFQYLSVFLIHKNGEFCKTLMGLRAQAAFFSCRKKKSCPQWTAFRSVGKEQFSGVLSAELHELTGKV